MDPAPPTAPADQQQGTSSGFLGPMPTDAANVAPPATGADSYQSRLLMDLNPDFNVNSGAEADLQLQDLTGGLGAMGLGAGGAQDKRPKPSGINNKEDNEGKLFVGGLSWETTKERLIEYFSTYGQVKECIIMRDPQTQRSRGFGFITFIDPQCCIDVIKACPHTLDNRQIDPKPAVPHGTRQRPLQKQQRQYKTKKIFVGGLAADSNQESLTAFFSEYGTVENVILMFDRETKRPRGFGFVTFSSEEPVLKLCKMHFVELAGKMVEIKMAQPKASVNSRRGNRPDFSQNPAGYQFPGYGVAQQFTTTYDSHSQSYGQPYGSQAYPFQSYPTQAGFVRGPQGFVPGYSNQGAAQGFMYFQQPQDGSSRSSGQFEFDSNKSGEGSSSMFSQTMSPYGHGNNFQYQQGGFVQQQQANGGAEEQAQGLAAFPQGDGNTVIKPATEESGASAEPGHFDTAQAESLVGNLSGDPIIPTAAGAF